MQVCNLPHNISDITKLQLSETKRRYYASLLQSCIMFWTKNCVKVEFTFFAALKQWPLLWPNILGLQVQKYKSKTSAQNFFIVPLLCTRKWDVWLKLSDLIWDNLDKTDFFPQPVKLKALRINWSAWAIRTAKALAYFGGFFLSVFLDMVVFSANVTSLQFPFLCFVVS